MVQLLSRKSDPNVIRLLRLLRDESVAPKEKEAMISYDASLREASDSFCVNCGRCCVLECTAREESLLTGKVYCKLHDGAGAPAGYPVREPDPDPARNSKPITCRLAGPGTFYALGEMMEENGKAPLPCYLQIRKAMKRHEGELA